MAKEHLLGRMEIDLLGSGEMTKDMERELISMQMEAAKNNIFDLKSNVILKKSNLNLYNLNS